MSDEVERDRLIIEAVLLIRSAANADGIPRQLALARLDHLTPRLDALVSPESRRLYEAIIGAVHEAREARAAQVVRDVAELEEADL